MIEVGEYVRTRVGEIYKVTKIDENYGLVYFDKTYGGWSREELDTIIKKHSKNIIDLIEVGDFVNGYKVIGKNTNEVFVFYTIYDKYTSDDIESILTHEQYEQNCYNLEEEEWKLMKYLKN